ncbi:amino acid synthesis family protein, partial [Ruegeria sp.]
MPDVKLRKTITSREEIFHEGGPVASDPVCRASVLAIIHNPFAGRYEPD